MQARRHLCLHVHAPVAVYAKGFVSMHVSTLAHIHACIHACMDERVSVHMHMGLHTHTRIREYWRSPLRLFKLDGEV